MKTLHILRHAKSDWSEPGQDDIDRNIRAKGIKRTELIINHMVNNQIQPELIISSHALRAIQTAKLVAKGIHYPPQAILINPRIYYSNEDQLTQIFFELSDTYASVLLVGHNPAFTDLANYYLQEKITYLPTSGLVSVDFNVDSWVDADRTKILSTRYVYPKMFYTDDKK